MLAVTSLGPSRIERQLQCVQSWLSIGLEVVAVQGPGEAAAIARYFPRDVNFVETSNLGSGWSKLTPRIDHLFAIATTQPSIVINSDILLDFRTPDEFLQLQPPPDTLQVGIRYEVSDQHFNPYGIDVYWLTDAHRTPRSTEFAVGIPGWDYWVVWDYCRHDYPCRPIFDPRIQHLRHPEGWNAEDHRRAWSLLRHHTRKHKGLVRRWILSATGRAGWRRQSLSDHTKAILSGSAGASTPSPRT